MNDLIAPPLSQLRPLNPDTLPTDQAVELLERELARDVRKVNGKLARKFARRLAEGHHPRDAAAMAGYSHAGESAQHLLTTGKQQELLNAIYQKATQIDVLVNGFTRVSMRAELWKFYIQCAQPDTPGFNPAAASRTLEQLLRMDGHVDNGGGKAGDNGVNITVNLGIDRAPLAPSIDNGRVIDVSD